MRRTHCGCRGCLTLTLAAPRRSRLRRTPCSSVPVGASTAPAGMVRTVAIPGSLCILAIGVLTLTRVVVKVSLPGRTRAACRLAF